MAGGTKLRRFPKEMMKSCEAAAYKFLGELMSKRDHWKRIYPAWKKFRDELFLWFRVAENSDGSDAFHPKLGHKFELLTGKESLTTLRCATRQ